MSNCLNLKWDVKDGWIAIHADETKNVNPYPYLNQEAKLLDSIDRKGSYVFTYAGRKISGHPIPLGIALKKCNLEGYRWHDIRHTCNTHHVQNEPSILCNILAGI